MVSTKLLNMKIILAFVIGLLAINLQAAEVKATSLLTGSSVVLADATAKTNSTIGVRYTSPGGSSVTNTAANGWIQTATVRSLANGAVSDNTSITAVTTAATAGGTNTTTIVFERSPDGLYWDSSQTFSVAFGPATTAGLVTTTNVPTSFLQGTRYVRIYRISNNDVAGDSTNYVTSVTFNQPQ